MSSLATADSRGEPAQSRAANWTPPAQRRRLSPDTLVGLMLAVGLCAEVFITTGGVELSSNTWAEIGLTLLGAATCAVALLYTVEPRLWGAGALALLGALTALTIVSISWSVQPANSWVEANRQISYLAVFAGAVALARLAPRRWPALIGAIAVLCTMVSGYALLLKVYPASLDPGDVVGRLRAPFDYFNAVGLIAALGLPAGLWTTSRREGNLILRTLSVPAMAVMIVALMLSYSRGALIAAIIGVAVWVALVPLRLRGLAMLALSIAGGGSATLWALKTHPITHDGVALSARTAAGHSFGSVLLVMVVVVSAAALAATLTLDQATISRTMRRRARVVLLSVLACIPVAGVGLLAASSRGLTGEISHVWDQLTNPAGPGPGTGAGRLVQVSNSRAKYWSEGLKVGRHDLLHGVGAVGYGTARTRYSHDKLLAEHAHSYVIETFADFGLIGILLTLALLIAWSVATWRTLCFEDPGALAQRAVAVARSARRAGWRAVLDGPGAGDGSHSAPARDPATAMTAEQSRERVGLLTLLAIVVVFGFHSAIDWTWFIPGVAVPALLCAGWLAGRGPITRALAPRPVQPALQLVERRVQVNEPLRLAGVASIAALALVCVWMIVQPLRSADAGEASIAALASGNTRLAIRDANDALRSEPVAVEPLWDLAAIYGTLGDTATARAELIRAIRVQPANYATWLQLGDFYLQLGQPRPALRVLDAALYLYPFSPETLTAVGQAQAHLLLKR